MSLDIFFKNNQGIVGIFAKREVNIQSLISYLINVNKKKVLIVDTNHRWNSQHLNYNSFVLKPKTIDEFLNMINNLSDYFHPRLKYVIIDDLPIYFRHFYSKNKLQNQNMRAYGFSLSILKKYSEKVSIVFRTYPNGFNSLEPIMLNHTQYYADKIYLITLNLESYEIKSFPENETILSIKSERLH